MPSAMSMRQSVVDQVVMPAAQRNAVREIGRSFISPVDNVMNFAPSGWY